MNSSQAALLVIRWIRAEYPGPIFNFDRAKLTDSTRTLVDLQDVFEANRCVETLIPFLKVAWPMMDGVFRQCFQIPVQVRHAIKVLVHEDKLVTKMEALHV